jgi:hypothetical protein
MRKMAMLLEEIHPGEILGGFHEAHGHQRSPARGGPGCLAKPNQRAMTIVASMHGGSPFA